MDDLYVLGGKHHQDHEDYYCYLQTVIASLILRLCTAFCKKRCKSTAWKVSVFWSVFSYSEVNLSLSKRIILVDCGELIIKDTVSGIRLLLATECPLKVMKNGFHFALKALVILKIFKFLFWLLGHEGKKL